MTDEKKTYTLILTDAAGDRRETTISEAQLLDAGAGKAFAYVPCDEEHFVDEDGRIITRESAIPKKEAA